jgi:predicted metal-dependent hydrolase
MYQCALTTIDNPFDPFEQFDDWFLFDVEKGYNSCSILNRIAHYSDEMTQKEIDEETERAIDEIIKNDFMNIYKKVKKQLNETQSDEENLDEEA